MVTVLEQRIFEGLAAIDEQATIEATLFLDDPVAATVLTDKDDAGRRVARWRFDEFHFDIPLTDGVRGISSRPDMNSSAMSSRLHKDRIGLRCGRLDGLVKLADERADSRVARRLIPMIEHGIEWRLASHDGDDDAEDGGHP